MGLNPLTCLYRGATGERALSGIPALTIGLVRDLSEPHLPVRTATGLGSLNSRSFLAVPVPPGQAVTQGTFCYLGEGQESGNKLLGGPRHWEERASQAEAASQSQVCSLENA